MSNNTWPNCLYSENGFEINSVRSWILKFELCMYYEIYLYHRFYLFRSLAPMLKQIQLLGWECQLQELKSLFLQFCHALGLKINLILLLRHFWTLNYPTFNSKREIKFINYSQARSTVPLKIPLMSLLFESWICW